jgi:hypothetical protein
VIRFSRPRSRCEKTRNIGDLIDQDVDSAVYRDNLLVGIGESGAGLFNVLTAKPSLEGGNEGFSILDFRI